MENNFKLKCMSFFLFLLALAACNKTFVKEEEVIHNYFEALATGKFTEASEYISEKDRAIWLEIRTKPKFLINEDIEKALVKSMKFEIQKIERQNGTAEVLVKMRAVNLAELLDRNKNLDKEELQKQILKDLESQNFTYDEINDKISLVLENGEWKISTQLKEIFDSYKENSPQAGY